MGRYIKGFSLMEDENYQQAYQSSADYLPK